MKKNLTPAEAYLIVKKLAKKEDISIRQYIMKRGVKHQGSVSKWQRKTTGTINLDMAQRLGIV